MTRLILPLPAQLNGATLCRFANEFSSQCEGRLPKEVDLDFSTLKFIRPSGVTFLSNFIEYLSHNRVKYYFNNHTTRNDPLKFLDDSCFFEMYTGKRIFHDSSRRMTTFPLRQIRNEQSHALVSNELVPWLMSAIDINRSSLHTLKVCILEIFNNIKDHSTLDIGGIFAQHFPKEKDVTISIADFGKGIPATVRGRMLFLTDAEAIVKAIELGFTSRSTPRNRGAGLDFLLQTVVAENGGSVTIFSLTSYVLFYRLNGGIAYAATADAGFCPGTTIEITFRTDAIRAVPDEPEELEW
jgi:hypothetical protein